MWTIEEDAMTVIVTVTDAKAQLTELVRRAEAGEDVVLTRHGRAVVRLSPVSRPRRSPAELMAFFDDISREASAVAAPRPSPPPSHDNIK
jgi:prevent-host-death family protein